jgi:hypothetical protein
MKEIIFKTPNLGEKEYSCQAISVCDNKIWVAMSHFIVDVNPMVSYS